MSSGGSRVSIPNGARKTIQNIREIAGNHSDEEIYAMLQECSMDPNETAQKLLLQDTFHEVKRKRDRRKDLHSSNISNNREPADSRWRPASQGRGSRGGRGNSSSRYLSHDATGGRNASIGKENGDRSITTASVSDAQDTKNNSMVTISSSAAGVANGTTKVGHPISAQEDISLDPGVIGTASVEDSPAIMNKIGMPSPDDVKCSASAHHAPNSEQFLSTAQAPVSGVYASASDPVLVNSLDARNPVLVGAIKHEVGSQRSALEAAINKVVSNDVSNSELPSIGGKGSLEISHSYVHGKMPSKCQIPDTSQSVSSSYLNGSVGNKSSSNFSSRSQQQGGSQKAGPTKEWKPKSTNVNPAQASETFGSCDVEGESVARSQPASSSTTSMDSTTKLQKKLLNLQFSEAERVIIPDYIQVPESERTGLRFGSFGAIFDLSTRLVNDAESDKSSTHPSESSSQETVENTEETCSSNQFALPSAQEAGYPGPHTPERMPESLSSKDPEFSSTSPVPEYDQSKPEAALTSEGPQYSVVHTASTYASFGIVPQMLGSQFPTGEGAEQPSRDSSRPPSFVPFDPTSIYTQMYRPTIDGAFLAPSAAAKYNGNITMLPAQTSQSPQENGNSLVLSSTVPTPLVTQAGGVLQSSVAVGQQPVPVFRQPAGVHMSHFPPNCIPYSQYFSPFYVPPPTIHHFLSNSPFPQQPPAGSMYPPPAAATGVAPVKYSISQYKPANNSANQIALPTGYGAYSSNPAGYSPVTSGISTGTEDLTSSQYKENNVYISGQQQTEGSAVWIPATGRDVSALQASSSFYNVPQGQHMTFAPTQAGHGAFSGLYHPAQTVAGGAVHLLSQAMPGAAEMVGPPASVYQSPQRAPINWTNNY